jgi:hypothetical protein
MRRIYFLLLVMNMALFQAAGTGLVRLGSQHLVAQQRIALEAGYAPLPEAGHEKELTSRRSALAAGLFYSLSLGIGLTAIEAACIVVMTHIFTSPAPLLVVFGISSLLLLFYARGIFTPLLWITGALFISFLVVLGLLLREQKNKRFKLTHRFGTHGLFVPLIITVICAVAYISGVRDFAAVRDLLLLPHGMGQKITDFYYKHTLMAARPLESLVQKSWLLAQANSNDFSPEQWARLQSLLLNKGIFLVSSKSPSKPPWYDLSIENREGKIFVSLPPNGTAHALPMAMDSSSISELLTKMSQDFDPMRPLKRLIMACLGILCPLFLLTVMARLILWMFNLTAHRLTVTGALTFWLCAAILLIGLVAVGPGRPLPSKEQSLNHLAWTGDAFQRVRAARILADAAEKGNLHEIFLKLAEHPDFRVRIWAARGLSCYSGREVTEALFRLTKDGHLAVVTSSIYALSRQPDGEVRETLKALCTNYPHPYGRDAAFRALKGRGWLEKIPKDGEGGDVGF